MHAFAPSQVNFNPRSPHGERRGCSTTKSRGLLFQSTLPARGATRRQGVTVVWTLFQSTLPARGATRSGASSSPHAIYFNPRSPHGERLKEFYAEDKGDGISIHAPRTGSDRVGVAPQVHVHISIHAPRTGSDTVLVVSHRGGLNFNPRSPHGERPLHQNRL